MTLRVVTLSDLRDRTLQRIDGVGTGNRLVNVEAGGELDQLINLGANEMHVQMASIREDWIVQVLPLTVTGSTISLPDDYWEARAIDEQSSDGTTFPILRIDKEADGGFMNDRYDGSRECCSRYRYRVENDQMIFYPLTSPVGSITIRYVPTGPVLVDTTDELPRYLTINGWDEFIVLHAAAIIKRKKDEDPGDILQAKEALRQQMVTWGKRDATGQKTVARIRTAGRSWLYGGTSMRIRWSP